MRRHLPQSKSGEGGPLSKAHPNVYVDGICLKWGWDEGYGNVAVMAVVDVDDNRYRVVISAAERWASSPRDREAQVHCGE